MESAEKLDRLTSPDLDKILGQPFKVLDDGFVRVVDYMGSDASIVQAARVSYGKGTKKVHEDRGLIRYLMRHRHSTPFEMAEIKLHVRVPMDCWRQWIRHRTANVNEYSTRYSEAIDSCQKTPPGEWRLQSQGNRQGSSGFLVDWPEASGDLQKEYKTPGEWLSHLEDEFQQDARSYYKERLAFGVAREQARKDLPLSTYTEAYWKVDLHNLLHFLGLRMDSHAQKEIRDYATTIGEQIVSKWVPHTWEAFVDYRREGLYLTRLEKEALVLLISDPATATQKAEQFGWLQKRDDGSLKTNRERSEFEAKCGVLGIAPPWSKPSS